MFLKMLLALSLLLVLLSFVPLAECKKGHPKERHHGNDRIGRNATLALAIHKHDAQPLLTTPTLDQGVKLTSLSSSHDYLSSLLPPQASSTRHSSSQSAHSPSRSLSVDPSHFHAVYKNASLHPSNASTPLHSHDNHSSNDTEVTLTDSYHVMYTAEVGIGSPPQQLQHDTGHGLVVPVGHLR